MNKIHSIADNDKLKYQIILEEIPDNNLIRVYEYKYTDLGQKIFSVDRETVYFRNVKDKYRAVSDYIYQIRYYEGIIKGGVVFED